jgi:hypothetical protein
MASCSGTTRRSGGSPPIRRQYGLTWGPGSKRALAALLRTTGAAGHLVPGAVRRQTPDLFIRMARRRAMFG